MLKIARIFTKKRALFATFGVAGLFVLFHVALPILPNTFSLSPGTCFFRQVSKAAEDARTSHPCESGAGSPKTTSGDRRRQTHASQGRFSGGV